ncbi:MAG: hypothetical protein CMJ34_07510 [Phycisphaerae bacterium]|nr:hypothetical protein [Phycisphaerae bacterium]
MNHESRTIRSSRRRGIESIELLLGLPVLLLVVAAGIEYGWMILRSSQLDHAARVGARAASLADADGISVTARVNQTLAASGIETAFVDFLPGDPGSIPSGEVITVVVSLDYSDAGLLGLGSFMPLPDTLAGRAAMVREP